MIFYEFYRTEIQALLPLFRVQYMVPERLAHPRGFLHVSPFLFCWHVSTVLTGLGPLAVRNPAEMAKEDLLTVAMTNDINGLKQKSLSKLKFKGIM